MSLIRIHWLQGRGKTMKPLRSLLLSSIFSVIPFGLATADDWPQWRGPNRDGIWTETGLVNELPDGQLPLDWSVEIGPGYTGPTVAGGKVYVMDRQPKDRDATERVLCFDSSTGKSLWTHEYQADYKINYTAGPRASVTIDNGKAYCVGAMGHFHCLNASTGMEVPKG